MYVTNVDDQSVEMIVTKGLGSGSTLRGFHFGHLSRRITHALSFNIHGRSLVALLLCSKALAAMRGRDFTTPDDVRDIARPVLRHRLSLRAEAELDGATPDAVIMDILNTVEVPR